MGYTFGTQNLNTKLQSFIFLHRPNVSRQALKNACERHRLTQSIVRKVESLVKSITQKGNAHLGLGQFDEAKECYESLRPLGENSIADHYLKKLHEAQERYRNSF